MSCYFIFRIEELNDILENCDSYEDCGMSGMYDGYKWFEVKKNDFNLNIYFKYLEDIEEKEKYYIVEVSNSKKGNIPAMEGTIEEIKKVLMFSIDGEDKETLENINNCETIDELLKNRLFGDSQYKEVDILEFLIASEKHRL